MRYPLGAWDCEIKVLVYDWKVYFFQTILLLSRILQMIFASARMMSLLFDLGGVRNQILPFFCRFGTWISQVFVAELLKQLLVIQ